MDRQHGAEGNGYEIPPSLRQPLAGLNEEAGLAMAEMIVLYREFPAWAIWLPDLTRCWTAVRVASRRPPGPELPLIWVQAATSSALADRMRSADRATGRP